MPITYERDDARTRIDVTLAGTVTVEDLLSIVDRQAAEQTWHYALYYDARRITKDAAGTVDEVRRVLRHVVETSATHGARGPVAIVTDNPADYSIVRMYSTLGADQHVTVEVFRDPSDALRWLDAARRPSAG
jgi:RecJ-like exonuclease